MDPLVTTLVLVVDKISKLHPMTHEFTGTPGRCWYSNVCAYPSHRAITFDENANSGCYMCKHPKQGIMVAFNNTPLHMPLLYVDLLYTGTPPVSTYYPTVVKLADYLLRIMNKEDILYGCVVEDNGQGHVVDATINVIGAWRYNVETRSWQYTKEVS